MSPKNNMILILILYLSGCASSDFDARDGVYIYEDVENPSQPSARSIAFEPSQDAFYMYQMKFVDYKIRQYTEFAGIFTIERGDGLLFSRSMQMLIPDVMTSNKWSGFGYSCNTQDHYGKKFRIKCVSEKNPSMYSEFEYDEGRGVTSFLFSCPYKSDGCIYGLKSSKGIFSSEMRLRSQGNKE